MASTRDNNFVPVIMGVDSNGVAAPVKVDSVTGYVLMAITSATTTVPVTTVGKRDSNFVMSRLAIDSNGAVAPILIDNRSDLLWVSTT